MGNHIQLFFDRLQTPIGMLWLVVDDEGRLRATTWDPSEESLRAYVGRLCSASEWTLEWSEDPGGLRTALLAYFNGAHQAIQQMPVLLTGTPFQRAVWMALRQIPCGTTWSYAALARYIGRPSAVRAVGLANSKNPIGIVVPCHRVIGSDGSLTGFAGGIHRKQWLLEHEGAWRALPLFGEGNDAHLRS